MNVWYGTVNQIASQPPSVPAPFGTQPPHHGTRVRSWLVAQYVLHETMKARLHKQRRRRTNTEFTVFWNCTPARSIVRGTAKSASPVSPWPTGHGPTGYSSIHPCGPAWPKLAGTSSAPSAGIFSPGTYTGPVKSHNDVRNCVEGKLRGPGCTPARRYCVVILWDRSTTFGL